MVNAETLGKGVRLVPSPKEVLPSPRIRDLFQESAGKRASACGKSISRVADFSMEPPALSTDVASARHPCDFHIFGIVGNSQTRTRGVCSRSGQTCPRAGGGSVKTLRRLYRVHGRKWRGASGPVSKVSEERGAARDGATRTRVQMHHSRVRVVCSPPIGRLTRRSPIRRIAPSYAEERTGFERFPVRVSGMR